jgi:L-alanine-DL-glutamate epimerase-like enolase superfamily enzyme
MAVAVDTRIERLAAAAYTVPTEALESDGTLEWNATSIVVAEVQAGGETGLGYTYTDPAAAALVTGRLADALRGLDAHAIGAAWEAMGNALRNVGRPGIGFCALSAVDLALWDVKAKVLGVPLVELLPTVHEDVELYASGGFTSQGPDSLRAELERWAEDGFRRMKLKVGRDPEADPARLDAAREAIGEDAELYVDANGAFGRKDALAWAERYALEWSVGWFEEPVSSADLDGLRLVREHGPPGLDVAAGEYAYVPADFRNLLAAGAVDCLQADVTRCGGITGFLRAAALAAADGIDISAHCAPAASVAACCAAPRFRHLEWFHDHVRVEALLFEGAPEQRDGVVRPERSRPGGGIALKRADAERFRA